MKKICFLFITILLLSCVSCNSTNPIKNNPENLTNNDSIINYKDFAGFNIPIDNITLKIDGKTLPLTTPVYFDNNRYFICFNEVIDLLKGTLAINSNSLSITTPQKNFTIDIEKNLVISNNKNILLKKALLVKDNTYYINLSDLTNILDVYARWDSSSKTISCKTVDNSNDTISIYQSKIDTLGFLRIEDVSLSTESYDKEYLEKLRIISNYLYKRNIPYHIAWIPHYINPTNKIDVDPLVQKNFTVAELIFTLDYITNHNGLIGLRGYTHQNGNEISGVGFEFGKINPSPENFRTKIEMAIKTAKELDIPISFFEAPHYGMTIEQNKIAEEYFKFLYYPFYGNGINRANLTVPELSPYNNSSYYIATPLEYIHSNNIEGSLTRLKNADTKKMGSIFYHPRLDFDFISLTNDNDTPSYTYLENSPLKRLTTILEEKGYKMSKVTDIQ